MTKKEIVKRISEQAQLTQIKTKKIVQWTFDAIIDTLATDGRIELRKFGVFEVRERKARIARNPRTGETVKVPPKNVVTFQPGKEMEERVRVAKAVNTHRKPRKVRPQPEVPVTPTGVAGTNGTHTETTKPEVPKKAPPLKSR